MELLSGYPKAQGMEIAVRTLSPQYLLCDEIGNQADVEALLQSLHAGVRVVAAAHGDDLQKLLIRDSFSQLHQKHAFDLYCHIMQKDKKRSLEITEWEAVS
jgi:stage III sporulation protein AA